MAKATLHEMLKQCAERTKESRPILGPLNKDEMEILALLDDPEFCNGLQESLEAYYDKMHKKE